MQNTKGIRKTATSIERLNGGWCIYWEEVEPHGGIYYNHHSYWLYSKKEAIYLARHKEGVKVPRYIC